MDSVPPATTTEALPVMIVWAPRMIALMEEAQTLLTVVATVDSGSPAPIAHWRAGFWPKLEIISDCGGEVGGKVGSLCGENISEEDLLDFRAV